VEFRVLGDLEVRHNGETLPLGAHQQRAVLAILVLHAGEVVSADRLIDELWGDEPPPRAAKTVQVYVSRLRKVLTTVNGQIDDPIVTRDHGYVLRIDPEQVDASVFERLLDEGRRACTEREFEAAATVLRNALGLWRGSPLADFTFDAFAANEIARLEELRLEALETRIDADLALGRHVAVVAELEALTAEHPLRERLRAQRMLALYRSGREPEALALYRETRTALVDELGMEPSPALRELHEAILRQDPALKAPAPASRRLPVTAPTRATGGGEPPGRAPCSSSSAQLRRSSRCSPSAAGRARRWRRTRWPKSIRRATRSCNAVVQQITVGARPGDIAAGAGGVWVANLDDSSVSHIDPKSATLKRNLSIAGARVDALAATSGAVWTMDYARATATKIDAGFGDAVRMVHVGVPAALGAAIPSPIAVGGGWVWAATGRSSVARINERSGRIDMKVAVGNEPAAIAVGAGAAWVADDLDNTVSRIDAAGVVTATTTVGNGASGVAIGDGAVWVANTLDNTVTRIDAANGATKAVIQVGAGPRGVAVGAGSVWVADSRGASVSRIDPRTNRVQTIAVGGSPEGVAVAAGRVWVTVQAGSPSPSKPLAGGTLRVVQQKDFGSTDPALLSSYGPQAAQLGYAICAKLLNYPDRSAPRGTRLVPEVAAALPRISRDGRTYTFAIRPGFRFSPPSSGPVTARAFRRAIERMLSPAMPSGYSPDLADIVGLGAYRAGRTKHIAGVTATASTLTIRLTHRAPDLPARLAMPQLCAVPPDTPIRTGGVENIPSAGPYYITSHTPNAELVLRRNPNYHGSRPRRFDEIVYQFGATPAQAAALVEADRADYANAAFGFGYLNPVPTANDARLERDYGTHSLAARAGRQRYFVNRTPALQHLMLNARRPLFASARMRQAANFAVDRAALARNAGSGFSGLPTDQYLPNSMPGFRDADIYPLGGPDVARARRLAKGAHRRRAVMYTCKSPACLQLAETVKGNLRAIDIAVDIKEIPAASIFDREGTPGEPYDIAWFGWVADYADPSTFIDAPFTGLPVSLHGPDAHDDRPRVTAAAKLTGPQRLRAYGQLDIDLATHAAPAIAFADLTARDFFSSHIGCQAFQPFYGMDLAALCRRGAR
jgi:YVTN family beta-propeller protein